jgi:polysaccharide export outer membrane protein
MGISKWALGMLFLIASALFGQSTESLLIGPGDLLHVQVFDNPDMEQHVRVTDSGELPLILGGNVKIANMTPSEASRAIETALLRNNILLKPRVQVTVEVYATQKVSVLGEVKLPGAFSVDTPRSVLDVLALAGGLTDLADRKVVIERHGTSSRDTYFVSNQPNALLDAEMKVYPGDTVFAPKAGLVYALGDVAHPGGYTMTNNDAQLSVLQLVARAGSTPPNAVPSHAKLLRKTSNGYIDISLPLSDMQKGKRADILLQPDDIVYVPFSYLRNFALNAAGVAAAVGSAAVYRF